MKFRYYFKRFYRLLTNFLINHSVSRYIILFLLYAGLIALILILLDNEIWVTLLSTVLGFLLGSIFLYFIKALSSIAEDSQKIMFYEKEMRKYYKNNYDLLLKSNGTEFKIVYEPLFINLNDEFKYRVDDNPNKTFMLDDFIYSNYNALFHAHENSFVANFDTVRLDDFVIDNDSKQLILKTSRSTFFNHLVTNRAADLRIQKNVTLRNVFEYGPYLKPINESAFANHIGINALVFLKGGWVLFPYRRKDSTISKNKITSSIASRLIIKDKTQKLKYDDNIFIEDLHNYIIGKYNIPIDVIKSGVTSFLGFGRNIYEAGKPQFYYAVILNNYSVDAYFSNLQRVIKNSKTIDVDQEIFVCSFKDIEYTKQGFIKTYCLLNKTKKKKIMLFDPEKSMLNNFYHLQLRDDLKNILRIDNSTSAS